MLAALIFFNRRKIVFEISYSYLIDKNMYCENWMWIVQKGKKTVTLMSEWIMNWFWFLVLDYCTFKLVDLHSFTLSTFRLYFLLELYTATDCLTKLSHWTLKILSRNDLSFAFENLQIQISSNSRYGIFYFPIWQHCILGLKCNKCKDVYTFYLSSMHTKNRNYVVVILSASLCKSMYVFSWVNTKS